MSGETVPRAATSVCALCQGKRAARWLFSVMPGKYICDTCYDAASRFFEARRAEQQKLKP